MHETQRYRIILSAIEDQAMASIAGLERLTGASAATIRRDIAALHRQKKLRRVRGGAVPVEPTGLAGRSFAVNEALHICEKQAIARAAVALCQDGDPIIINGGTTTFQMVHPLAGRRMQVFTNSLPIVAHLLAHSKNTVTMPGGTVYREQNIVLSPFEHDATCNFYARRMFMGAHGIGPMGLMEADPLLIRAEEKLIKQADELVILADSSKFTARSGLVLCALNRIDIVITDKAIPARAADMLENAGIRLIVAHPKDTARTVSA